MTGGVSTLPSGTFDLSGKTVWVAGHAGMVGSAIVRRLASEACTILTADRSTLDLTRQGAVETWVADHKPQVVVLAAARVGGILANATYPAEFLRENLLIEANIIHAAHANGVEKLLFLGSSCVYPRLAAQPIAEDALLTGPLEPTNAWYAVAKIAGVKLCQAYRQQYGCDFISAMPCNLYGPGDNFDPSHSHVIAALIRKAHVAKAEYQPAITLWGTGTPRREFLHVDDCADALVHVLKSYSDTEPINVGCGEDISVHALAARICDVVGFTGRIETDPSRPDGTPQKLLDNRRLRALGWSPTINLRDGLKSAYAAFIANETT